MAIVDPSAGILAARLAGDDPIMDAVAAEVLLRVQANAAARGDTAFASSLSARKVAGRNGVKDRIVVATDPLAAPKEFGHVVRNEKDGPIVGYAKPLRYMRDAWESMPAVSGD